MTESEFKWCDFTAGCIAGFAGTVIGHPMDTIKVRQQTLGKGSGVEIARNTFKYEGARGFFKGMMFPALTAGALNSIFFGVYGNTLQGLETLRDSPGFRRTCAEGIQPPHPYWHLDVYISGCIAGFAQVTFGCPIDLIKIKLQSQTGNKKMDWAPKHYQSGYAGPLDCIKQMYREHGIRGFYRGYPTMVFRFPEVSSYRYIGVAGLNILRLLPRHFN